MMVGVQLCTHCNKHARKVAYFAEVLDHICILHLLDRCQDRGPFTREVRPCSLCLPWDGSAWWRWRRALLKKFACYSQQLSTTLNKSFNYYSQQVFHLLSQPTLSTTIPSHTLEYKNTDHRLNQCSIDNISIISYIQKTYNTIFNKDCWGVLEGLRDCWGIEGWWKGSLLPFLGSLLLSFASSCLFGRSNTDSRSKELLSEPLPTSKVCLAMMILWSASWFPTRNWAMMRLSVLRNLVAGFCVSCILESVVSPLPTPCHGRPSHWHAPELPWPPWLENNLQSLLATSQSTALRRIMGKGALIFWTWGAQHAKRSWQRNSALPTACSLPTTSCVKTSTGFKTLSKTLRCFT